jgi:hypothetical protein
MRVFEENDRILQEIVGFGKKSLLNGLSHLHNLPQTFCTFKIILFFPTF